MLLVAPGISGSCPLPPMFSHFVSFQTTSLCCESCSPVPAQPPLQHHVGDNPIIQHTKNCKSDHTIHTNDKSRELNTRLLYGSKEYYRILHMEIMQMWCVQQILHPADHKQNSVLISQNPSIHSNVLRVMTRAENMTDKNQNGCQSDYSMHMNQHQPYSIWLNYPNWVTRISTKFLKSNNKIKQN